MIARGGRGRRGRGIGWVEVPREDAVRLLPDDDDEVCRKLGRRVVVPFLFEHDPGSVSRSSLHLAEEGVRDGLRSVSLVGGNLARQGDFFRDAGVDLLQGTF